MKFILSTEDTNSYGYKVKTDGIQIPSKLPLLFNHDPNKVIGEWLNIELFESNIIAEASFDIDDDEALKIMKKVEKGLINGTSIGFSVLEKDVDEQGNLIITKSLLKEASITPLPANVNAIKLYDNGIELTAEDIITLSLQQKNKSQKMDTLKKLMEILNVKEEEILDKVKNILKDNETFVINIEEKQELINKNSVKTEEVIKTQKEKIEELQKSIDEMNKKEKEIEIKELIDKAIEDGKILEEQKEEYTQLSLSNLDIVKNLIEKSPKINSNKITDVIEKEEKDKDPKLEWTFDEWSKNDPIGLREMKLNNLEKYDELYGKQFFKG